VVVEVEVRLIPKPEGLLSGVVFFTAEEDLLGFVREAREQSIANRGSIPTVREGSLLDARALEYFDVESLKFLRQKYETIPNDAGGAILFEQETNAANADRLMTEWTTLLDAHNA